MVAMAGAELSAVIARSLCDEAIQSLLVAFWIAASLRSSQ
jgi:hypothetical protein